MRVVSNRALAPQPGKTIVCNASSGDSRIRVQTARAPGLQSSTKQQNGQVSDRRTPYRNGFGNSSGQGRRVPVEVGLRNTFDTTTGCNVEFFSTYGEDLVLQSPEIDFVSQRAMEEPIVNSVCLPQELAKTVRAVILAGGETSNPLTRYRAMPAVPMGSSLYLVDIPINNSLRAGINKIYVLTQFQSQTLNSHIAASYPPVKFGGPDSAGWVEVLAAQQTVVEKEWYKGSADAIRKNISELKDEQRGISPATDYIIMSGSAVYNMDFSRILAYHRERGADITMCTHLVKESAASSKGIAAVHSSGRIMKFEERPSLEALKLQGKASFSEEEGDMYLANMGIYIFKRDALFKLLDPAKASAITHIGHHVIPNALAQEMKVFSYHYTGYWHDVSTLRDYYEVNLDMASIRAPIKMFEVDGAVTAKGSQLPPAIFQGAVTVENAILDDGSVLVDCSVTNSVVGQNVYIGKGSVVEDSVLLGSPVWNNATLRENAMKRGERVYGIGNNCVIRNCVVDENVTIGNGVRLTNAAGVKEADRSKEGIMIQDGLLVVLRDAIIPDGYVL